jgi:alpha-L-fucosidase
MRIYLHVFDWPSDGKLTVPKVPGSVTGAQLLDGGEKLKLATQSGKIVVQLPSQMPDRIATVVALDVAR